MKSHFCPNCFEEKSAEGICPHCGYDPSGDREKYPMALRAGTVLGGKYIIGRVLGEGGFGITYLAQDYRDKTTVALKEYFPDSLAARTDGTTLSAFTGDREEAFLYGKECFLEEAQTLSEFIGNESIVRVYSYFEENNTAYFAMEFIRGKSLQTHLAEQGGKISFEECRKIILPVMDALEAIHEKGIVHRDIAPDNIILTDDGGVKLIDFGAARYSLGDRSRSLDVVLKHGYAPMEQYTRRGRQGPYTDVYALCATIYKSLTGRTPPDAVDRMDEDTLIPPSVLGVKIPQQAEDALMKGLMIQYRDRYRSIRELKDDLFSDKRVEEKSVPDKPRETTIPQVAETLQVSAPPAAKEQTVMEGVSYAPATENQPAAQPSEAPAAEPAVPKEKKNFSPKKLLAIGIPAVALILAAVIVLVVTAPKMMNRSVENELSDNQAEERETILDEDGNEVFVDGTFRLGETWTLEDQWSFTIKGIYEISDRYPAENEDIPDPEAVYLIDFEYTNLGYYNEKAAQAGLNSSKDKGTLTMYPTYNSIVDSTGESAFQYQLQEFPAADSNITEGNTGQDYICFGVNHRGPLSCSVRHITDPDHGSERHQATFQLETDDALLTTFEGIKYDYQVLKYAALLEIGKTWTIEDQWSLTINSVTKTDERDEDFSAYDVAEVYIIDYTYTNINYLSDYGDFGLYIDLLLGSEDSAGVKCSYYSLPNLLYSMNIKPGETCNSQSVIAVSQPGGFKLDVYEPTDKYHGGKYYYLGFYYDLDIPSPDVPDRSK